MRNIGVEGWRGLTIGRSKKGRRALIEGVGLGYELRRPGSPGPLRFVAQNLRIQLTSEFREFTPATACV